MSVLEFFEGHPERWTQGALAKDAAGNAILHDAPDATRWCLVGAVCKVYPLTTHRPEQYAAFDKLHEYDSSLSSFNDTHTFEDVVELVRKAGV